MNLLEAFDAARAVCGDAIVPPDYRSADLFDSAISCDPETLSFKEAANAGIVHTLLWLMSKGCAVSFTETGSASHKDPARQIKCLTLIGDAYYEQFFPFGNDGTASLYAALLNIAVRVGKEAKETTHGT